jgi:hypothetical protein
MLIEPTVAQGAAEIKLAPGEKSVFNNKGTRERSEKNFNREIYEIRAGQHF